MKHYIKYFPLSGYGAIHKDTGHITFFTSKKDAEAYARLKSVV